MREAEEAAFARGVEVEKLMEQAGAGIARAVVQFFPRPGRCIVFAGKGHNGGDALN
jgi:NAD(P)H-hydrate epimerase